VFVSRLVPSPILVTSTSPSFSIGVAFARGMPGSPRFILVGEIGRGETLERHAEGNVLDDPAAKVEAEAERLLLQGAVERRLLRETTGELDAALQCAVVRDDLAHDPHWMAVRASICSPVQSSHLARAVPATSSQTT